MELNFALIDVTNISLIGPRFQMTVFRDGFTDVHFFTSREAAAKYRTNYFGRLGPKVIWTEIQA